MSTLIAKMTPINVSMKCSSINAITYQALEQLGQRFGIRYVIEGNPSALSSVARGEIYDVRLSHALQLTLSDIQVERAYTSASYQAVPWFISIILEGEIRVQIGEQQYWLKAGEAFCAHFDAQSPMTVHQPVQPRLRTVNLAVVTTTDLPAPPGTPLLRVWQPPAALQQMLCANIDQPANTWRQPLVWQGLALQLLGLGLPELANDVPAASHLTQRDCARLTELHQRIMQQPTAHYCLQAMAKEAAMSPSSLRQKFRARYGSSLFEYIRQSKLAQAYQSLEGGYSVQQVAHSCGYKHASNFSTAFKRMFGVAPHSITKHRSNSSASPAGVSLKKQG